MSGLFRKTARTNNSKHKPLAMGNVRVRGRPGVGRNTLAHRGTARNRLALDIALYVCMRVCTCTANMRLHRYTGETRCSLMRRASACAVATEFQSSPVQEPEDLERGSRRERPRICVASNDIHDYSSSHTLGKPRSHLPQGQSSQTNISAC